MIKLKEQKIKQMIAETGHSVRKWGKINGFPQGTLSGWLTGARNIKRSSLEKLADALGTTVAEISTFTFVYTGEGIEEMQADQEEIASIFAYLNKSQRKAILNMANLMKDGNQKAELAEVQAFEEQ